MIYRKENGLQPGFESLVACKPILAVGAATPLEDQEVMEDGFRKSWLSSSPISLYERPMYRNHRWERKETNLTGLSIDGIDGLGGIHEKVRMD